ncbi:unnamed protein product [Phaedon cochleariae]|uniref:Nuclear pore complex protein Nup88 n=1 Tax=Phaedon cochleariae TaxID=80249 RepID=A0A9N9SCV3_PHACE|nr:unnamed protein product [Phaedon cochleariae]
MLKHLNMYTKTHMFCRSYSLDERLLSCSDTVEVRRVKFHPGSIHHNHILILTSDNMLRLYQIKDTEALNIAVIPVGQKPTGMFPGSKTPFLDIYGEIAVDFDFGHPEIAELPPSIEGNNEKAMSKYANRSKEEKYMINVETQTFDKIATKDPTWNRDDWDKLVWPIYILRGDMTIHSLNMDLKKRWKPSLRGPLPMSSLENNGQNEACSLVCLNTVPQIMCIAQSNGTLCHSIILDIEEDEINKMKENAKFISHIPTKELCVFETIELELGLMTNEDDLDSKYKCPIFLKKDESKPGKYYATHSAGVHSVAISCVKELQHFVDSQEDPTSDIFINPSRAEYMVCTKTVSSQKVNPVIGFALYYEPPAIITLLSDGNLVTLGVMYTSDMPKIEDLTVHEDDDIAIHSPLRKMLQEPFDQYIQKILKKTSTQPILKLASTGKTNQEQCYELLQRAAQVLREEYFKNHAKAREELEKRVQTLLMMKKNQQKEIQCMNDETDRMQEKASNLAEKYEDIKDKQDDLLKKCENLLMLVSRKKSAPSDAEKAFMAELHTVEEKVVAYGNKIDKIKNKMKYQQIQMENWKAQETKKVSTINATHTNTIKTNLQETSNKITEMIKEINDYKKMLNLKDALQ